MTPNKFSLRLSNEYPFCYTKQVRWHLCGQCTTILQSNRFSHGTMNFILYESMLCCRAVDLRERLPKLFCNLSYFKCNNFSCFRYHVQNDELLGSWLLLLANIPVIPYALIYLAKDNENWVYWGALIVSVIFVMGSTLFVQACYPSTKVR